MWNVYVIEESSINKLNSAPYDIDQIQILLEQLGQVAMILVPCDIQPCYDATSEVPNEKVA